jgi:apolipoprotein D and lipocalin family protein
MRLVLRLVMLSMVLLMVGCTGVPKGLHPVTGFEVRQYLGKWYEVARLDHRFERGLTDVSATYTLRDDDSLSVVNRGFSKADSAWKEVRGTARFRGDRTVGSLKVTFFWPFYGGYHVIALDKDDYEHAMVAGPSRSYLWILSRTRELDRDTLDRLVRQASELGFATDRLIHVRQDHPEG